MALEAYLNLHRSERFNINRKLMEIEDCKDTIEDEHHQICLSLPKVALNLRTLPDPANSAKTFAMKFNKGTTTLSFIYDKGVVVCADSRATGGSYIGTQECKKIIPINKYMLGTMAGGAADCAYWQRVLSKECRLFELRNKERISVAAASKILANILYNYKGMGLSIGTMICGWDKNHGPQIFSVDNDGNRIPGKLFSVGSGSTYAYGVLDSEYDERKLMDRKSAIELGRRAIFHATHRDAMSGGIIRVYVIEENGWEKIEFTDMNDVYDEYLGRPELDSYKQN